MLTAFAVAVLTISPILVVAVLLELAAWRDRRREVAVARQIAVTDAIAWEMGAIVAPEVKPALWGPWELRIAVPLSRPMVVGRIVAIADRVLARIPGRHEIVLTPQEPSVRLAGPARMAVATTRAA
jgi:hypothetical protein